MKMAVSNVIQILTDIQYPEGTLVSLAGHLRMKQKVSLWF